MTDITLDLTARQAKRVSGAFAAEELLSLERGLKLRLGALAVIAVWLPIEGRLPEVLFYVAFLPLFAANGALPILLRRRGVDAEWTRYLMPGLDVVLITLLFFTDNPLAEPWMPAAEKLKLGNEIYYYVLIAGAMSTYAPRVVLFTGLAVAAAWVLGGLWVLQQPGVHSDLGAPFMRGMSRDQMLAMLADPSRVVVSRIAKQAVVALIVAAIMAALVSRMRALVLDHAVAERERSNLARYFSPNMVDALAHSDEPLRQVRTQNVAVLFVDIVGFTRLSEGARPERVIELLRAFHGRMEKAVFSHGGTLDKYLGDGLMATFGTPLPRPGDAANALACGRAMVAAVEEFNAERERAGEPPIRVGVGIHYGPVVLGDIGGEARFEYAVIGDTVNVASRLEQLTRELGAPVVASDDAIAAARGEVSGAIVGSFHRGAAVAVRGRERPLDVWLLGAEATRERVFS